MRRILSIYRSGGGEVRGQLLDGIVAGDGKHIIADDIRYRIKEEWDDLLMPGDHVRFVPRSSRGGGAPSALELEAVNGIEVLPE